MRRISVQIRVALAAGVLTCVAINLNAREASAQHLGDVLIDDIDGRLFTDEQFYNVGIREVDVFGDGTVYRSDDPGYNTARFGALTPGDSVSFEIATPLFHWSNDQWLPTTDDTYLRYYYFFDSVVATGQTAEQAGFELQTAGPIGTIHVHGIFELGREGGGTPNDGAFALGKRLTSPQYDSTELFFFVIDNGMEPDAFDEARAAAETAFLPAGGDFNRDGAIDHSDYDAWREQFGGSHLLAGFGADGNADGIVNAADYTVWRDAFGSAAASTAVPEPSARWVVVLAVLSLVFVTRRKRKALVRAATLSVCVGWLGITDLSKADHVDMMLYQQDGQLRLGGYSFGVFEPIVGRNVFPESLRTNPSLPGIAFVNGPGWSAIPGNQVDRLPVGSDVLPAGAALSFDVLASEITGRNLSHWDGSSPIAFGPPPAGEVGVYGGMLFGPQVVLDGADQPVAGFEFATAEPSGYVHVHLDFTIYGDASLQAASSDAPSPGVYLIELAPRVAGVSGEGPSAHVLLGVNTAEATLEAAERWVSTQLIPEPSTLFVAAACVVISTSAAARQGRSW